jgi:ATP-dependent helicase/nuclease subunit A
MAIQPLTILPAGAGSGKTHTIQKRLAEWVVKGEVAPDRILAVTFTEAAASELKGRVRSELVKRGRIEDALKLEQSYISTIHGFGLRVLTEFAFDNGISPAPRLLDDDEQKLLVRKALSATDKADSVSRNLGKFGYKYDQVNKESPETVFRKAILGIIDKLRSLGPRGRDPGLLRLAGKKLVDGYGPTEPADVLEKALLKSVRALLEKHPSSLESEFMDKKNSTRITPT